MSVRNGTAAKGHTRSDLGYSYDEMDRRIKEVAARAGIGRGAMVVRQTAPPRVTDPEIAEAAEAVLRVLANGRPAVAGFIVHKTGLSGGIVALAIRALAAEGRIVEAGMRRQATGRPARTWAAVKESER